MCGYCICQPPSLFISLSWYFLFRESFCFSLISLYSCISAFPSGAVTRGFQDVSTICTEPSASGRAFDNCRGNQPSKELIFFFSYSPHKLWKPIASLPIFFYCMLISFLGLSPWLLSFLIPDLLLECLSDFPSQIFSKFQILKISYWLANFSWIPYGISNEIYPKVSSELSPF